MEDGIKLSPAELCLPVKVFLGHIESMKREVDALFIPRLVCRLLARDFYFGCPKAIALPDLVRAIFPELPPIIELILDERDASEAAAFFSVARQVRQIRTELRGRTDASALLTCKRENDGEAKNTLSPENLGVNSFNGLESYSAGDVKIGIIGHPYLIFDECISLGFLKIIKEFKATPIIPVVSRTELVEIALERRSPNWYYELELITGAKKLVEVEKVNGLLFIASFACGTAPVINEIIRREILKRNDIPFLTLTIDEHTVEVGLRTRVESFVDLLQR